MTEFHKIKPVFDRILVKRDPKDEVSAGGIYIPSSDSDVKNNVGKVLAVGKGRLLQDGKIHPMGIKVGDRVYFQKYGGIDLDSEYVIIREDEVLGKFED